MAENTSEESGSGSVGDQNAVSGNASPDSDTDTGDTGGLRTVDPTSGTVKRGRGRPPGSGKPKSETGASSSTSKGKAAQNAIGLDDVLFGIHAMAAAVLMPELAIDQSEAKLLAGGINGLNQHYGKTIDPKVMAWIGLATVVGKVYGPRVAAYTLRKGAEKKAPKPAPLATPSAQTVIPKQENKLTAQVVNLFNNPEMVSLPQGDL